MQQLFLQITDKPISYRAYFLVRYCLAYTAQLNWAFKSTHHEKQKPKMKKLITPLLFISLLLINTSHAQNNQPKMDNKKNYSVEIIRYNISKENQSNFEQAYTSAAQYLRSSKYCLGYQLIHGKEEPNHYIVIIHWTSMEEHLNGFRKSPEFMPFFNLVKPFYNNIEEMKHYELTPVAWQKE
jgi:quinol monooxygenase YgiN